MNLPQVGRLMAGFVGFFTLAQVPPLLLSLTEPSGTYHTTAGFLASIVVGGIVAILLFTGGRAAQGQVFRKEAIAVAGLAWVVASLLGALPFRWSGLLPSAIDALFEAASGLTTTGATVLGSGGNCAVDAVPRSLLLWRAETQWLGGLGIVLVFVSLLPAMGVTGKNLLATESVGVGSESYQPRAVAKARTIVAIYVVLTIVCLLALRATGSFGWFDALCHSFTTLSTGGFATRTSIRDFDSLAGELVLVAFMFLGGCSFSMLALHWRSGWRCIPALARTGEFRIYTLVTLLVVGACCLSLCRAGLPFGTALREATFNSVSVLTSTGFATANFQAWPALGTLALFAAMFVGGCSGSTAGGFKQIRLLVILKLLAYTIRHFISPKSVERLKLDEEVLPAATISSILAVVLLWFVAAIAGAAVVACDERLNFVAALSCSVSLLGSTGPALSLVDPAATQAALAGETVAMLAGTPDVGPFGGYGDLQGWTKLVLTFQMILGRLELLTLLALFTPSFWRR
jgi:trk system potassium uptake protein TrkH